MGRAGTAAAVAIMGEDWGPLWKPGTQEGGGGRQSLGQGSQDCLERDAPCSRGHLSWPGLSSPGRAPAGLRSWLAWVWREAVGVQSHLDNSFSFTF